MRKNIYGNICSILVETPLYCTILKKLFLHFQCKVYGCSVFLAGEKAAESKNPERDSEMMVQLFVALEEQARENVSREIATLSHVHRR